MVWRDSSGTNSLHLFAWLSHGFLGIYTDRYWVNQYPELLGRYMAPVEGRGRREFTLLGIQL